MILARTAVLATLLLASAAPLAPRATPIDPRAAALDEVVRRFDGGAFWGAVLVMQDDEIVLARGYGEANDDEDPITSASLFDIASNAKAFTALAILMLQEDGKLTLDDPVSRFFPQITPCEPPITLRHLLTHTSGLSDGASLLPLSFPDRDEAVRHAFDAAMSAPPGFRFQYCNAGYVVLAAVIEKASGQSFESFVRTRIMQPAGMKGSGFLDGVGIDLAHATTRHLSRGPGAPPLKRGLLEDGWGWGYRGAGGLLTSLDDLVQWKRALLDRPLVSADAMREYFRPDLAHYALGWVVARTPSGGRKIHHGGSTRGYRSHIALYPEDDVFIAVLTRPSMSSPAHLEQALAATLWNAGPES